MKFISFILILLAFSCSKQSPENLDSTHRREDLTSKKSCNEVVFLQQTITQKNITNFLDCTNWNKEYPKLFNMVDGFDEKEFNFLTQPFNDTFFSSKTNRARYFDIFKVFNKAHNGFQAFDFYLKNLIPPWTKIAKNYLRRAESDGSLKFLDTIKLDKNTIKKEMESYVAIQKYFLNDKTFRKELAKAFRNKKTVLKINEFLKQVNKLNAEDRKLLSQILWAPKGAVASIARDQEKSLYNFSKFVQKNKKLISKSGKVFEKIHNNKYSCKVNSNKEYIVDVHRYVWREVKHFTTTSSISSRKRLAEIGNRLHLTINLCPNQELQKIAPVATDTIAVLDQLCSSPGQCNLFKSLLSSFDEQDVVKFYKFISSEKFNDLTILLDYLAREEKNLFISLDRVINNISPEFLSSQNTAYLKQSNNSLLLTLTKLINSFNEKELIQGAALLGKFLEEDKLVDYVNPFFLEAFTHFPEVITNYLKMYQTEQKLFFKASNDLLTALNDEVLDELVGFLSTKSLLKLYKQFIGNSFKNVLVFSLLDKKEKPIEKEIVQKIDLSKNSLCVKQLNRNYIDLNLYFSKYPKSCLYEYNGFVHYFSQQIAMFSLVSDTELASSLLHPDLLPQIVSLTKGINKYQLDNRNFTKDLMVKSHDVIKKFDWGIILDEFINSENTKNWSHISSDPKIKDKLNKLLNALKITEHFNVKKPLLKNCRTFDKEVGAELCLKKNEFQGWLLNFKHILLRKNERQESALLSLIELFYPDKGVSVPVTEPTKTISIDLKEFIGFFHVLSQDEYKEYLPYKNKYTERIIGLTILEQIEVLLRDLGFYNNYYGAYFKNGVADSDDYIKAVKSKGSKFSNWSWLLTGTNYIPPQYEVNLDNATATFESLIKLDREYKIGNETMQFGNITHGILSALVKSSKLDTQDIPIYQRPDETKSAGHNGVFLTELAKIAGLTNIGEYFQLRFPDLSALFSNESFKVINENLMQKFKPTKVAELIEFVLESAKSRVFIDNIYHLQEEKNLKLMINMENSIGDFLYLVARSNLKAEETDLIIDHAKAIISTLTIRKFNIDEIEPLIIKIRSFIHQLKKDQSQSDFFLNLMKSTTAPKNYDFLLPLLKEKIDLIEFFHFVANNLDYKSLGSYLKAMSRNKQLIYKDKTYFREGFKIIKNLDDKNFAVFLENLLQDIDASFELKP